MKLLWFRRGKAFADLLGEKVGDFGVTRDSLYMPGGRILPQRMRGSLAPENAAIAPQML